MTEEEKLLSGKVFDAVCDELVAIKRVSHNLCIKYNGLFEDDPERPEIIKKIVKKVGKNFCLNGPIWFNYGKHTSIGDNFFANYNFHVSDDAYVTIGNDVMIGPNTTIVTPLHPLIGEERKNVIIDEDGHRFKACYAKPVTIGNNVWIAASVTICPGVTIGDGAVIGAGSVVTKDVPPNTLAAGVPCRVIREITDKDRMPLDEMMCGEKD